MELDIRIPGAAFPPQISDDEKDLFWLHQTRNLIALSRTKRRTRATAAIASFSQDSLPFLMATDGFPYAINDSAVRQQDADYWDSMHLDAAARLVATAAETGRSLLGAIVYYWPMLTTGREAALLIEAGVMKIVEPDYPIPLAQEGTRRMIRTMASEAGVILARLTMDANLVSHSDTPSEQA